MKTILKFIIGALISSFSPDANPNLFRARKRRMEYGKERDRIAGLASDTQDEINQAKSVNPFEGAAAKSAMAKASRGAKQMQKRVLNTMGAGATAESKLAGQQVVTEGLGAAAGQIATGAEALKEQKVSNLKSEKLALEGQQSGLEQTRIGEYGQGLKSWGNLAKGVADVTTSVLSV